MWKCEKEENLCFNYMKQENQQKCKLCNNKFKKRKYFYPDTLHFQTWHETTIVHNKDILTYSDPAQKSSEQCFEGHGVSVWKHWKISKLNISQYYIFCKQSMSELIAK